jgi:hypothetical protein
MGINHPQEGIGIGPRHKPAGLADMRKAWQDSIGCRIQTSLSHKTRAGRCVTCGMRTS